MSAVDAPPGLALSDLPTGELGAVPQSRALARRVLVYAGVLGLATLALASRKLYAPLVELLVVTPFVCFSVALLGHATRRARLRIDNEGIRWGWRVAGFRMRRERIDRVSVYRDAIVVTPRRGSLWCLARRDWARFDTAAAALAAARIPHERVPGRAPLRARLQGYGLVLDILLVIDALLSTLALILALSL